MEKFDKNLYSDTEEPVFFKLNNDTNHDAHSKVEKCLGASVLYVIAVISNPARYDRRYQLFNEFCNRMQLEPQVRLVTIELQHGMRDFATNSKIRLRAKTEIWHKENMINIAIRKLPPDWEYVAWIDTDISFKRPDWCRETLNQLQTHKIVQLFSSANDMGPRNQTLITHPGFCYQYYNQQVLDVNKGYSYWHPGYAWACRREIYENLGGLIDFTILGSGDYHMAMAFIENVDRSFIRNGKEVEYHGNYRILIKIFEERCKEFLKKDIGYVEGTIDHHFHGDKKNRGYATRDQILIKNKYDPLRDIIMNADGLWELAPFKATLRDQIRIYFRQRNEDSQDLTQDYPCVLPCSVKK